MLFVTHRGRFELRPLFTTFIQDWSLLASKSRGNCGTLSFSTMAGRSHGDVRGPTWLVNSARSTSDATQPDELLLRSTMGTITLDVCTYVDLVVTSG